MDENTPLSAPPPSEPPRPSHPPPSAPPPSALPPPSYEISGYPSQGSTYGTPTYPPVAPLQGYAPQSGYAPQPAYAPQPGYASKPEYAHQPGHASQPGYGGQSGYGGQLGYGGPPGYGGQPGYVPQAGYLSGPTDATHSYSRGHTPAPVSLVVSAQPTAPPFSSLLNFILVALFCNGCCVGVASLIFAMKSNSSFQEGKFDEARYQAEIARRLFIAAIIVTFVICALLFIYI